MPMYNFACADCDELFDIMVPMVERDGPQTCPNCGGDLARKITAPGMVWAPTSTSGGHR